MMLALRRIRLVCAEWIYLLCAAVLLLGAAGGLQAVEISASPDFTLHSWDPRDGLPDARVQAVAQTSDGYWWIGTTGGLARFDGMRFEVFTTNNTPELRQNRIACLLATRSGALWVGTESDLLMRRHGDVFEAVSLGAQMRGTKINALAEAPDGSVWIGTGGAGIARWRDGRVDWFSVDSPSHAAETNVTQIITDKQGRLWAVANEKLAVFEKGAWTIASGASSSEQRQVVCLAPSRDGGIWVATSAYRQGLTGRGTQVFKLDGGWTGLRSAYPWNENSLARPRFLLEDRSGNLWLALDGIGLYVKTGESKFKGIVPKGGVHFPACSSLAESQEGIIWGGTGNMILLTPIPPKLATTIPLVDKAKMNSVTTACARRDGSVWLGTDAGLYRQQDGKMAKVEFGDGADRFQQYVEVLWEDRQTNLWMGTQRGLYRISGGQYQTLAPADFHNPAVGQALTKTAVLALHEDSRGNLWAGTAAGIARLGPEGETFYGWAERGDEFRILAIEEDPSGQIWAAVAGHGLYRKTGERFEHCGDGRWAGESEIYGLCADADGGMWVATWHNGIGRFKDGRFTDWTKNDGLPTDNMIGVTDDAEGNLWFSSNNGIFGCPKSRLLSYQRGASPPINFWKLSVADGMESVFCSGGGQPSMARSADGRLWVPNMHAVAVFDPAKVRRDVTNHTAPACLQEILVDGIRKTPDADGTLRVESSTKSFEFHYTSPAFLSPEQLRFRYLLKGLNREWVEAGTRRVASYVYLPTGDYEFQVQVKGADGAWRNGMRTLPLEVLPLFWERRPVQLLGMLVLVVLVAAAAGSVSRARMRRRLAAMERQRALEQERSRIARDMHDEIGARLTQITLLSAMADDSVRDANRMWAQARKISDIAQSLTGSLDEIVWAVRPQNDNLESLVDYLNGFLRSLCEDSPVRYWFSGPPAVPPAEVSATVRHNILLACTEAVNNTLKHSGASEVRVSVRLQPDRMEIEITDNGRGFDVAAGEAKRSGLTHIRQRLRDIGGSCECESRPGTGTHFTFIVPLLTGATG